MPEVLALGAPMMCPHGGRAIPTAVTPRVLVGGAPALTLGGTVVVAGCALMAGAASAPTGVQHTVAALFCLQATPVTGSTRVTASGKALLLSSSVIVAAPSGLPVVAVATNPRVQAL